jgi:hypothetical protein
VQYVQNDCARILSRCRGLVQYYKTVTHTIDVILRNSTRTQINLKNSTKREIEREGEKEREEAIRRGCQQKCRDTT